MVDIYKGLDKVNDQVVCTEKFAIYFIREFC